MDAWLVNHVPHLIQLAMLPLARTAHERYFTSIGWTIIREDWYPETCLEIHFSEISRRIVAVYEETERGLGMGLYALSGSPAADDFYITSQADFDKAFFDTLNTIRPLFGEAPTSGTYRCEIDDHAYKYAYWTFSETFLTLVQHFEGDGHCGHEASLDLRIVPRAGSDRLVFPLRTNILF